MIKFEIKSHDLRLPVLIYLKSKPVRDNIVQPVGKVSTSKLDGCCLKAGIP